MVYKKLLGGVFVKYYIKTSRSPRHFYENKISKKAKNTKMVYKKLLGDILMK